MSHVGRGVMTLDWAIVGGGIHGVHVAAKLVQGAGLAPKRLRIADPEPHLLARWKSCAAATGMDDLRSPAVHHLDSETFALQDFAEERSHQAACHLAPPYNRPSLSLFNDHCQHVVERLALSKRHLRERVVGLSLEPDGVRLSLGSGRTLRGRRALLAIGQGDPFEWTLSASPGGVTGT